MNIIQERRKDRLEKIKIIEDSIKKAIVPDLEKLEMYCCSNWGISRRTAKELIKVAQYNIENAKKIWK